MSNKMEPVARRVRYCSEPGMLGHYPWSYQDGPISTPVRPAYEGENLYTAAQLEEAVRKEREACAAACQEMPASGSHKHDARLADRDRLVWPAARDIGRLHDMSPAGHLRVGLDSDNDVYVQVFNDLDGVVASVEFCNPGAGGGRSSRTRKALIALMVAMEADNAERPALDWWALRGGEGRDREVGGDR